MPSQIPHKFEAFIGLQSHTTAHEQKCVTKGEEIAFKTANRWQHNAS